MFHRLRLLFALCIVPCFSTSLNAADEPADMGEKLMQVIRDNIDPVEEARRLRQYELFQREHPYTPLVRGQRRTAFRGKPGLHKEMFSASSDATPVERVLLLVNSSLYADQTAKERIDRYTDDIGIAHGCTVEMETLEGGSPPDIKEIIMQYYDDGGLDGVVQMGEVPPAWYESDNDPTTGRYDHYTCDLYYMDLDGSWSDADGNGEFDGHTKGSGDLGIEIFYGRIDATTMGDYGSEIELFNDYMDKLHGYYTGEVTLHKAALGYLDHDWRTSDNYLDEIYPNSDENELIRWTSNNPPVNKSDYLTNRLQKNYSALHMWCHAGHNAHYHHTGGATTVRDVYEANPKPIAYFQDGCHVSDFAAGRGGSFLGGAYVFNKSPTALLCLSGSRSGQWLGLMAREMFEDLAKNTCVGQAFKTWFGPYQNRSEERDKQNFIGWNYGYNIFGDPLITLVSRDPVVKIKQRIQDASAPYVKCIINRGAISISYALPQNSPVEVQLYTVSGKCIHSLVKCSPQNGHCPVRFSSEGMSNGSYILTLRSDGYNAYKRITIVK